jgi:hypothetical protein
MLMPKKELKKEINNPIELLYHVLPLEFSILLLIAFVGDEYLL